MNKKLGVLVTTLICFVVPSNGMSGGIGGGGSPPAVMDLSLAQFNQLARGALRGDLLERVHADGTASYYEPVQFGVKTMMARSIADEKTLILNGLGMDAPESASVEKVESMEAETPPVDPTINTVPRE